MFVLGVVSFGEPLLFLLRNKNFFFEMKQPSGDLFESENISKVYLHFALPSIIGMLIVSFQMMIDGIFLSVGVGHLGLAAVNLAMPLVNSLLSVGLMIISGGVVIASIAKGNGNISLSKSYASLTLLLFCLTLEALSILIMCNLRSVCFFLGTDESVYPYLRDYLGTLVLLIVFFCIPNFTEAFTRLAGKPHQVFVSGLICFVLNVVLDYVLVIRLNYGMKGAAVATCIANTTAALVLARFVSLKKPRGSWNEIRRIFFNGSSEMLTAVFSAFSTFLFNMVLMRISGPLGVAALTIVFYINQIVNMSLFGLSQAMYPLISYNLGKSDHRKINTILRTSMLYGAAIGFGVFLLVMLFKQPIVSVFAHDNHELKAIALTAVSYVSIHYLLSFINITASSFNTAVERPLESAAIALCRSIVFISIALFTLPKFLDTTGIWLSMPAAELLCLAVSLPCMRASLKRIKKSESLSTRSTK